MTKATLLASPKESRRPNYQVPPRLKKPPIAASAFNSCWTYNPKDRQTLLAIAEKLQLAADTFRAVRSESQATQALALREKALSMATLMDPFHQEDAA